MTKEEVIALVREKQPKDKKAFAKLGLTLEQIGEGVYRKVYKIKGTKLVVKIPNKGKSSITHAISEYEAVYYTKKDNKCEAIHNLLPEVYYFNNDTGIMLMRYYYPIRSNKYMISSLVKQLVEAVHPYAKKKSTDIHSDNIGRAGYHPVILDLGYFSDFGKGYGKRFNEFKEAK